MFHLDAYLLGPQQDEALFATLLGPINVVIRIKATSFLLTIESGSNLSDRAITPSLVPAPRSRPLRGTVSLLTKGPTKALAYLRSRLGRSMIGLRFQVRCIPFSLSVVGCPPLRLTRDQHTLSASFGPFRHQRNLLNSLSRVQFCPL